MINPYATMTQFPSAGTPTDELTTVMAQGRTNVRAVVMSMSSRSPSAGADARYLTWHQLDHMPEQYRLDGLRHGARWVSTPRCAAARLASTERFSAVDHLVTYLFGDPVDPALQHFFDLGQALREGGRMPEALPQVELAGYELTGQWSTGGALIGADVLPWRPATGIFVLIERCVEPVDAIERPDHLLNVAGVAGVWRFRGTKHLAPARLTDTSGLIASLCYLQEDPVDVAAGLNSVIMGNRGAQVEGLEFAGPFEALVPWHWDRLLPHAVDPVAR